MGIRWAESADKHGIDRRLILEVMAVITPPNDILVFHVMEARRKILDIAERETDK